MNDGGPAFPIIDKMESSLDGHPDYTGSVRGGMTLRDYFAAKAMQGGLIRWLEQGEKNGGTCEFKCEHAAEMAYRIADAHLCPANKTQGGRNAD
jgi:hypothetical protein